MRGEINHFKKLNQEKAEFDLEQILYNWCKVSFKNFKKFLRSITLHVFHLISTIKWQNKSFVDFVRNIGQNNWYQINDKVF